MRRKKCRAIECHKRIRDQELFCDTHIGILQSAPPAILQPIEDNREPAGLMQPVEARRILGGILTARRFIARKEGRAQAEKTISNTPPPTGSSGGGTGGGSDSGLPRPRSQPWDPLEHEP